MSNFVHFNEKLPNEKEVCVFRFYYDVVGWVEKQGDSYKLKTGPVEQKIKHQLQSWKPLLEEASNASDHGEESEDAKGDLGEHQSGDCCWEVSEAGCSDCTEPSGPQEEEKA